MSAFIASSGGIVGASGPRWRREYALYAAHPGVVDGRSCRQPRKRRSTFVFDCLSGRRDQWTEVDDQRLLQGVPNLAKNFTVETGSKPYVS